MNGDTNLFGKQRGRFDEAMAQRAARTLADECVMHFMALDDAGRREVAERINAIFAETAAPPRWRIERHG